MLESVTKAVSSLGCLGGSVGEVSAFGSGHDLQVLGWNPKSGSLLCSLLSLPLPLLSLTRTLSQINKNLQKKKKAISFLS